MQKPGARGESMVIDLTFAVFIFLLVAFSLTSVWSNKAAESEKQIYEDGTLLLAERALDTLITSSGKPQDWETKLFADVNVIGLAKSDRVLDEEKINKLIEFVVGEEPVKQKLLIGETDYYFRLIDPSTGEAVKNSGGQFIKIGQKPTNLWLQTTIKRPVVFGYKRRGEDEAKEHEAVAELTLFLPYRMW